MRTRYSCRGHEKLREPPSTAGRGKLKRRVSSKMGSDWITATAGNKHRRCVTSNQRELWGSVLSSGENYLQPTPPAGTEGSRCCIGSTLAASTLCRCRPACRRGTWGGGSGTDITTGRKNWGQRGEGELTWRPRWCSTGRTQRRQRACSASPPDYRRSQTESRSCRPPATLRCLSEMIDSITMIVGL